MKELIEYIARAIVDNPDEVAVREESDGDRVIYYLTVSEPDMGKVIGKQGRIANAMRTLLKVARQERCTRALRSRVGLTAAGSSRFDKASFASARRLSPSSLTPISHCHLSLLQDAMFRPAM
jgi:predicted RNA-binding protein YlqC (UPF0109 family)